MATSRKILGQKAPGAATWEDLYTVPPMTDAVVSTILVSNRSSTPDFFRIAFRQNGDPISDEHYGPYDLECPGNDVYALTAGITLGPSDVISVYNTNGTLTFQAFGQENS